MKADSSSFSREGHVVYLRGTRAPCASWNPPKGRPKSKVGEPKAIAGNHGRPRRHVRPSLMVFSFLVKKGPSPDQNVQTSTLSRINWTESRPPIPTNGMPPQMMPTQRTTPDRYIPSHRPRRRSAFQPGKRQVLPLHCSVLECIDLQGGSCCATLVGK